MDANDGHALMGVVNLVIGVYLIWGGLIRFGYYSNLMRVRW